MQGKFLGTFWDDTEYVRKARSIYPDTNTVDVWEFAGRLFVAAYPDVRYAKLQPRAMDTTPTWIQKLLNKETLEDPSLFEMFRYRIKRVGKL